MRSALFLAIVVLLSSAAWAQGACNGSAAAADAAQVARVRASLRAVAVGDGDTDVPPAVQAQLPQLQDALVAAARDVIACASAPETPATMETELAALLHANPPQPKPGESVRMDDPRYQEALSSAWSSDLRVHISAPQPQLLQVEMSFNIACGDDTVLLLFEEKGGQWREALRWQAAPYTQVSGAFGDGVYTAILTPQPGQWRLVAIHGHPWCTSRLTGVSMDVIAPTGDPMRPRVVWHTQRGASRGGDYAPRLKVLAPDVFEFRDHADAMAFDENDFERTVIYRYKLWDDSVTRLEPIATNARYFVDEWLTMPWDEARAQDMADAPSVLEQVHAFSHRDDASNDSFVQWQNGPVRACLVKGAFQVQMDVSETLHTNDKAGGATHALPTEYFQLREGNGGYVMMGVLTKPNPACGGADLMLGRAGQ
jgi:hypothetical protein